jgi:hypothetical protein
MSNTYYVYAYLREDGTPYYIGKGKDKRITAPHNIAVPKESNRRLKLSQNLTEEQAHQLEIELIAHYGRKDNGTGILRNLTDGGEGTSGWIPADSTKQKISESRKGKTYEEIMGIELAQRAKQRLAEIWRSDSNPAKTEKERARTREFMINSNPNKTEEFSISQRAFQLSLGDSHVWRKESYRAAQSKKMSDDGNIAKRDDIRQKISDNNPMKNPEHLNKIRGDNHYSKVPGYSSPLKWRLCCFVCRKYTTISGLARHHKHGASQ